MQDWDHAIEDFDYILYYQVILLHKYCASLPICDDFQPDFEHVLALRARAYCCRREWDKAQHDYETILSKNPDSVMAITGLSEMNPPYEDLPMLDKSVVDT
jgi:hypothetical protein